MAASVQELDGASSILDVITCDCSTDVRMILRTASQIPIGRTPGFLFRAIRRHAKNGLSPSGSTKVVQILLVRRASEWQISSETVVQILLHPCASIPAAPLVRRAAERMVFAPNMTG